MNMVRVILFICSIILIPWVHAQEWTPAIEDNSFLLEEAINQSDGALWHSMTLDIASPDQFTAIYTQEWPLAGETHQLGFTIPFHALENSVHGIGDLSLDYRYQLCREQDWAWIAPHFSFFFPTGNYKNDLGHGTFGLGFILPITKRVSNAIMVNSNIGISYLPQAKKSFPTGTITKSLKSALVGFNAAWLLHHHCSFVCEFLCSHFDEIQPHGTTSITNRTLCTGIRFSFDIGDVYIVGGMAVPITFTSSSTDYSFIFNVGLEQPW
ncbi:MAG: hypothetical protein N3A63_04575 [Bacteroidetes bacterium]|nr:hypothetical protein [Bacteroidota bacterium]